MRNILFVIGVLFCSITNAQSGSIQSVDFYSWVGANDQVVYEMALVVFLPTSEDMMYLEENKYDGIVRVKYSVEGVEKLVEYKSMVDFSIKLNDSEMRNEESVLYTVIIDGYGVSKFIKGSGSYTPDNFMIYGVIINQNEKTIGAHQIDDSEIFNSNLKPSILNLNPILTADDGRSKIKEMFSTNDAVYRDLMLFMARFD
jgi:hypothetical protein